MLALEPRMAKWTVARRWLAGRSEKLGRRANEIAARRTEDPGAIVVGYGPVGQTVTRLLTEFGINPMIIERTWMPSSNFNNADSRLSLR
jgi:CPA2 family monovalent cation:H+ antiporter-2